MITPEQKAQIQEKLQSISYTPPTPTGSVPDWHTKIKAPVPSSDMTLDEPKKDGILKTVGKAIISSEKNLGETIGQSAAVNSKDFTDLETSRQGLSDMQFKVQKEIQEKKKRGEDASHLEELLAKSLGTKIDSIQEIAPATTKTDAQALGEVAGVGLDLLTAGTYGNAAKGAKAGQLLTKSQKVASTAAKVGIEASKPLATSVVKPTITKLIKGGFKNVIEGAGIGEAYDIVNNLQEGMTGMDVFTKGYGKYLGAAIPGVVLGTKVGTRAVGEAIGATTGTGFGVVREAWKASMAGGKKLEEFQNALRGGSTPEKIVNDARDGLNIIIANRRKTANEFYKTLEKDGAVLDVTPIRTELDKQLGNFKIGIAEDGTLDFSRSKIRFDKEAQKDVETIFNEMKTFGSQPGDMTPAGVDSLKQAFGSLYSKSSDVRALVQGVKKSTRDVLSSVKGYTDSMKAYEDTTEAINDIRQGLSLGDKASVDTSFRKLTSALRTNNEFRKELIQDLDNASGGYLSSRIAGQQMSEWLPRGLARPLEGIGAIGALVTGVGILPILKFAALTSPRLVGEVIKVLGIPARHTKGLMDAIEKNLKKLGDQVKNTPNKQGGFVRIGGGAEEKLKQVQKEVAETIFGKAKEARASGNNDLANSLEAMSGRSSELDNVDAVKSLVNDADEMIGKTKKKINDFSSFHSEDQKFLSDFALKVKGNKPVTMADFKIAQDTWASEGYTVPKTKKELADLIATAEQSSFDKTIK